MALLYQNRQYIRNNIAKKREDGRTNEQFRDITIETGIIGRAEGSARVKIGDTEIIAGVKTEIGKPYPDSPSEGVIMVNSEFSALASPDFENGPPREDSIELSRVVDRGIRESKTVDVEKLCIEKGEKVWMVFVDITIVNHDGNLIDAAGIGAITALLTAQLPKLNEDGTVEREEFEGNLPITQIPVPVTSGLINNTIITDMSKDETECSDARFTVTTIENENYCAMQKAGPSELTEEQMLKIADIAQKESKRIRAAIKTAVKKHKA
ncbi:MAG: exosome complex protein Rrp42 [Candidatus Aenigmarchaeota archaeon]|nr:exosome complex protein Rrp42 [Candidatus Aenigmarchaeota archaeon]